jgi:hypothetical protein
MSLQLVLDTPTREMEAAAEAQAEARFREELAQDELLALVKSVRSARPELGIKKLASELKKANPRLRTSFGAKEVRAAVAVLDALPPSPAPPSPEPPLFLAADEPEPQPEPLASPPPPPPVGVSYEVAGPLATAAGSDTSSQFSELHRDSFAESDADAAIGFGGEDPSSSSASFSSTGRSPIAPFNPAALESSGCDWVTYASPHFDSRHELVQSMTRESLQDQARLSLHLDVPERAGSGGSEQQPPPPALSSLGSKAAPGSAPANMSTEGKADATGGDPAFATATAGSGNGGAPAGRTIFGTAAPRTAQLSSSSAFGRMPKKISSAATAAAAKARSGSWSRVTVESVRAPRTRANPRCMSIGTAKNAGPLGLAPLRYQ